MQEIVRKISIARHTLLTVQPDRTNFHNLKIGRTCWTVGEIDFMNLETVKFQTLIHHSEHRRTRCQRNFM